MVNWHLVQGIRLIIAMAVGIVISQLIAACSPQKPNESLPTSTNTPAATHTATWLPSLTPIPSETPLATQILPSETPALSPTVQLSATPQPCLEVAGRYEQHFLPAPGQVEPLKLRVYLPPCYALDQSRRYPVLYLFHGLGYTEDQWQRLGVGETLEPLLAAGASQPFLIVMPLDRATSEPDTNPLDTLFLEVMIPWVDQHYRTLTSREYRAVGGLSRGAGWALHFGLRNWEYFGAVGAHSLALFWYDSRHLDDWLDAIPPGNAPRLYLDMGNRDRQLGETLFDLLKNLDQRGLPHEWHLFDGYHDENYWRSHLVYYLRWYASGWSDLVP
jgi:enterochelin esterase-like enzyme